MRNIKIYVKTDTEISIFDTLIGRLKKEASEITITIENRRSFREYESLLKSCQKTDILLINDLSDLGMNKAEIASRLEEVIFRSVSLAIVNIPTTYEYGILQPVNTAVLETVKLQLISDNHMITVKPKSGVGRNKIRFPDNWDELYDKWEKKEISSKEFIESSGLKKATFYNMLTEYKRILDLNAAYVKRYKPA